jgi:hypothetical protein
MKTLRHFIVATGVAALLGLTAHGQTNTTVAFAPGKLVIYRGGDGILTIDNDRQHPAFLDEYDPSIPNQSAPIMSMELPTNAGMNQCMWFNAHAGSEGQGMTRSADRSVLTMTGYTDDIGSLNGTTTDTPSSSTNADGEGFDRGFATVDAYGNFIPGYSSSFWFGIQDGISQCNPRGIATDGSNDFWGCGTIAGTENDNDAFAETGTLFDQPGNEPAAVQTLVNSGYSMKIVNNVLYTVFQEGSGGAQNNGIYDFIGFPFAPGGTALVPEPNPITGYAVNTNLFLDFGSTYANVITFDMNPAGTIAYAADNQYGIIKYVGSGGSWSEAYLFDATNIGSGSQPKGGQGCFGIAVDFSGANPIIYATTMDEGDGNNTCSNRLISIVDTGTAPDPNAIIATTLAAANGTNEVFRSLDFAPDLRPYITSQPLAIDVITNQNVSMSVAVQSIFPVTYQWQVNGTNVVASSHLSGGTTSTLNFVGIQTNQAGNYTVIATDQYGSVTSTVANVTVTLVPVAPSVTNTVQNITAYIGNNEQFSVNPQGTPPFAYQWYLGSTALQNGDKYAGATSATLTVSNLQTSDSGAYYVQITNQASSITPEIANLNVIYQSPELPPNEPVSTGVLVGQTATLTVPSIEGTAPLSYQWYEGSLANPVSNNSEYNGAQTATLTISNAPVGTENYFLVVTNQGGSVPSATASVTVFVPSSVPYNGQIYTQNFDSLPDPGTASVNNGTTVRPVLIGNTNYSVSNPFDFAASLAFGGLNLSNTMEGWFSSDLGGNQIQATTGDQTTGLIVSFGCILATNTVNPLYPTNNRALGMLSSPATAPNSGPTADGIFALRLLNTSGQTLTNLNLSYSAELWRNTTATNVMTNWYYVDAAGTNTTPTNNWTGGLASIAYPASTSKINGTSAPLAITPESFVNVPLGTPWPNGGILWIVWEETSALSGAQGIGIDNLVFTSGSPTLSIQETNVSGTPSVTLSWPAMFSSAVLQSTTSLSSPNWQPVGGTVNTLDGINSVTVPISGDNYFSLGN